MTGGDASFGIDAENAGKIAVADAGEFKGFSSSWLLKMTRVLLRVVRP